MAKSNLKILNYVNGNEFIRTLRNGPAKRLRVDLKFTCTKILHHERRLLQVQCQPKRTT